MGKRVEVILGADGSVKVEASGFKGGSCLEATKFIRDSLGVKNDENNTKVKSSFYEEEETETVVNGLPSGWCG